MLFTTGFGLCNMCSNYHVGDVPADRSLDDTAKVHQLWTHRVKLDSLTRQQINHINDVHSENMGSEIPVIQYELQLYSKLVNLFAALVISHAGLRDNVISPQAACKITVSLDWVWFYCLRSRTNFCGVDSTLL